MVELSSSGQAYEPLGILEWRLHTHLSFGHRYDVMNGENVDE